MLPEPGIGGGGNWASSPRAPGTLIQAAMATSAEVKIRIARSPSWRNSPRRRVSGLLFGRSSSRQRQAPLSLPSLLLGGGLEGQPPIFRNDRLRPDPTRLPHSGRGKVACSAVDHRKYGIIDIQDYIRISRRELDQKHRGDGSQRLCAGKDHISILQRPKVSDCRGIPPL